MRKVNKRTFSLMTEGNNQAKIITGLYPQGLQARGDFGWPARPSNKNLSKY
jgi:hypothetical protein